MDFISINWLAVLVCVVVSMVTGFIWYSPQVFFNIWWKKVGKTEKPSMEGMGLVWTLTVLASAAQAVFLSIAVDVGAQALGWNGPVGGLLTAGAVWLGIVAPTYLVNKLFAGHGLGIWAIEIGNHLVNFLIFGAILGAWS